MYVIAGVTGNTGSVIADTLLASGKQVRVIARNADKAARFAKLGAEIAVADLSDETAITRALTGATGAFLLLPPDPTSTDFLAERRKLADTLARASRVAGVGHIAFLSSIGAQLESGTGPIACVAYGERAFEREGVSATFIRAGYFLENWLSMIPVAQAQGVLPSFMPADLTVPMVATRDIALTAVRALLEPVKGVRRLELSGPSPDPTPAQIATAVGAALGKPIHLVVNPPEAIVPTFTQFGISAHMASLYEKMTRALINHQVGYEGGPNNERVRGTITPEQFFAEVIARA